MKNTLTFSQLADYLQTPRRTLYRMISDGRLNVKPIEGLSPRRWSVSKVDKWLAGLK